MKFLLVFSICSAITGSCNNPLNLSEKFDSWSECVNAGGRLIVDASQEMNDQFNKDKLYVTYFCNEIPANEKDS